MTSVKVVGHRDTSRFVRPRSDQEQAEAIALAGASARAEQRAVLQLRPATLAGDLLRERSRRGARAAGRPTTSLTLRVTVGRCIPVATGQITRPLVTTQYGRHEGGDPSRRQGLPP